MRRSAPEPRPGRPGVARPWRGRVARAPRGLLGLLGSDERAGPHDVRPGAPGRRQGGGRPLGATWKDGTGGGTNLTTEGCRWFTKTLTAELDPLETPDWAAVIADTKAVLAQHGFPAAQESQLTGGFTGVESRDDKGARVTIQSMGTTNLKVSVPVSGPC